MKRSGIREIMDLAWGVADVLHLEVGEPDFASPPHVVETAARAGAQGSTKYTPNRGLLSLRDALAEKLRRVSLRDRGLFISEPQGSFYILADISQATDDTFDFARRLVKEYGVAVAPGEIFGPAGAGLVRLSLTVAASILERGIERLSDAVEARAGSRSGTVASSPGSGA